MKIGFFDLGLKNEVTRASFLGMYESFWESLEKQNNEIEFSYSPNQFSSDIVVVPMGSGQERRGSQVLSSFKGPVVLYVPPANGWFRKSYLERWKHKIIFAYGTDVSGFSEKQYKSVGISYLHLPFGSDQRIFRPLKTEKIYDIIFVGSASSGVGRQEYMTPLLARAKKNNWKMLLLGNGWGNYGFPTQLVAHGELLNAIYNLGKVCINIVNNGQFRFPDVRLDVNNRLFDLALAGCFQVSNAKQLISKYFNDNEVVAEDDPDTWVDKIEYYLDHPDERNRLAANAREKAVMEHTWDARASEFLKQVESNLSGFQQNQERNSLGFTLYRQLDKKVPPAYWSIFKTKRAFAKIKKILK